MSRLSIICDIASLKRSKSSISILRALPADESLVYFYVAGHLLERSAVKFKLAPGCLVVPPSQLLVPDSSSVSPSPRNTVSPSSMAAISS